MNLDELQSVQSRERQASKLQHLRASFYEEVGEYIGELRAERNRVAAASDDPFDDPDVERLSDEIRTAEQTVESIYERRVGKVVKLASIAAAGMSHQEEGLTTEEEQLFERLVDAIEGNRERVLSVLDGEAPSLDCTPADGEETATGTGAAPRTGVGDATGPVPGSGTTGEGGRAGTADSPDPSDAPPSPERDADAARSDPDAGMGAGEDRPTPADRPPAEAADPTAAGSPVDDADGRGEGDALDIAGAMGASDDDAGPLDEDDPVPVAGATGAETEPRVEADTGGPGGTAPDSPGGGHESDGTGGAGGDDPVERTTVRITADVGDIFGVDGRSYDLSTGDVVTLPASNAENLVSTEAAERLD